MTREEAIRRLVEVWLNDGQVANQHDAWLVLAKSIGKEDEAKEVIDMYTETYEPQLF
jgi:hypothetical protein